MTFYGAGYCDKLVMARFGVNILYFSPKLTFPKNSTASMMVAQTGGG